jgi:endonuclease YncB( thermonuclease family)
MLAEVINENNVNVNLEIIRDGFAVAYYLKKNTDCAHNYRNYLAYEEIARASRINIWSDPTFIPPWEYRKLKKQNRRYKQHDEF